MNQEEIASKIEKLEFSIYWHTDSNKRRKETIKIYEKDIEFSKDIIKKARTELRKLKKELAKCKTF